MVIVALILAVLTAYIAQIKKRYFKFWFFISFLILAVLCFCSKSGTDMVPYVYYYNTWGLEDLFDLQFEIGDRLLFYLLHGVIKNPYIGIGIIKIGSIMMIYHSIFVIRDKVNVTLSVISYICLLYIFNFHLIRMMLAVGIVSMAFSYEIIGKSKKCIILLIMAFFFHYSSILVLITFLAYKFLIRKELSIFKVLTIFSLLLCAMSFIVPIVTSLVNSYEVFSKYDNYISSSNHIGVVQIILFIPIALMLYLHYKSENNTLLYKTGLYTGLLCFFAGSLGYIYPVISRTVYYFYYFFLSYASSGIGKSNKVKIRFGGYVFSIKDILLISYLIMHLFVNYKLGNILKSNGVEEYLLFWK